MMKVRGNIKLIRKQEVLQYKIKSGKTKKLDLRLEDNLKPDYQAMFKLCSGAIHLKLVKSGYFSYSYEPYLAVLSNLNLFLLDSVKVST